MENNKRVAVITGACSGIGYEFTKQLSVSEFDEIWAISLSPEGLEKLKQDVAKPIRTFAWNLAKNESFEKYQELLSNEKPNITWLVNCAGFGKFGRYDQISINDQASMIDVNCKGLVKMTQLSIPYMQEKARIVQIASVAAFQPIPYIAIYGATKAFVLSYSRALNQELKSKNISVTCVCPFWTKTKFFDVAKVTKDDVVTKYTVMYDPVKVVAKAIKDATERKELSIYGSKARNQVRLVKILPHKTVMKIWIKQQKLNKKYK